MSYQSYIASHRFGLGSDVTEMRLIQKNPKAWLLNQLHSSQTTVIQGHFQSTDDLTRTVASIRNAKKKKQIGLVKKGLEVYRDEMEARFKHAIITDTPLLERLVLFWSNHFTVSFKGKPYISWLVGAYEREAIRPHVLGRFSDLLLAVVRHPAMLVYLDNVGSFGPNSLIGKRRNTGLNENLAREILELHTLGVHGGYTQNDVISLAKIITGWTVKPPRFGGGGYQFIDAVHEPGLQTLLGRTYPYTGEAQGIAALTDLANHPSTARFLATKIARHFIADTPPEKSIKKLEQTFLNTGGDLRAMTETLINMREVWDTPFPKLKKPYEMVVSTMRLTQVSPDKIPFKRVAQSLALLDHMPFQATSPAGWPDTTAGWLSPNSMMNRVEWCHALAQVLRPQNNPLNIAKTVLAGAAHPDTLKWIERAPTPVDGMALLLSSPEWQRR